MIHCVCHRFGDRGAPTLQRSAMSIEKRTMYRVMRVLNVNWRGKYHGL